MIVSLVQLPQSDIKIVGGASEFSVCFSGNLSVDMNLVFTLPDNNLNCLQIFWTQHVGDIFINLYKRVSVF